MKNILSIPLLLLSFLVLFNCKKGSSFEYKYANATNPIKCNTSLDLELLKEAIMSFEADISKLPPKQESLQMGYSQLSSYVTSSRVLPKKNISKHSIKVFEALKNEKDLWVLENGKHRLNYKHPILTCIGNNIKDKDLKTSFNALLTTNSMSSKLIGPVLRTKLKTAIDDKYLAAFLALDTYYTRFFEIDFTTDAEEVITKPTKPALQNK